jgi:hypothetical protein
VPAGQLANNGRVHLNFFYWPFKMQLTASGILSRDELKLLGICLALFSLYWAYLYGVLGFDSFRSDISSYWKYSFSLSKPFNPLWVPGYPTAIALVRWGTFGTLPPIAVMILVSGVAYGVGVVAVYRFAGELGIRYGIEVALMYAVYPFVGLTYAVYPLSDTLATTLLLLSFLYFVKHYWWTCTIFLALAVMTHKATWFFAIPLVLVSLVKYRESRLILPLAALPLFLLFLGGAFHHNDFFWFMRWSVTNLMTSHSSLPVLDAVFGTLMNVSMVKKIKGLVALAVLIVAGVTLVVSIRQRFWLGVIASMPICAMAMVMNQLETLGLVRFSKILVLPLAYQLSVCKPHLAIHPQLRTFGFTAAFFVCLATNIAFGYYMARVYFF